MNEQINEQMNKQWKVSVCIIIIYSLDITSHKILEWTYLNYS